MREPKRIYGDGCGVVARNWLTAILECEDLKRAVLRYLAECEGNGADVCLDMRLDVHAWPSVSDNEGSG